MAKPGAFDKDFGYLMPFLDKVAAAAEELPDAAAREELSRLMGEEKARWERIQELLGRASRPSVPAPSVAAEPARPLVAGSHVVAGSHGVAPQSKMLTVGSLKPRR